MAEIIPNERYWNRAELVAAHSGLPGMLDYERDVVRDACGIASTNSEVASVHVLGVGSGRELADIRAIAPAAAIHGWDISQAMVDACRRHVLEQEIDRVTVTRAAIENIPGSIGRPADVVVALSAVLCYQPRHAERVRTIEALRAMCRPGAGVAIVVQQRNGRPHWGTYFAVADALERTPLRNHGQGNRPSTYGEVSVLLHHYGRREVSDILHDNGFVGCRVRSLRQWATPLKRSVPWNSPNPLIVTATAG